MRAFCDLSLPSYTSDIVNVGIQQGGIDEKIPEAVTEEEMRKLLLFIGREDGKRIQDSYELRESDTGYDCEGSVYVLKESVTDNGENVEELAVILGKPMLLVSGFESGSDMTKQIEESMKANMSSANQTQIAKADIFDILAMLPEEQRVGIVTKITEKLENMPDTIVEQAATAYIKTVYEKLGMLASVLVGLLASRVAARTGRDLRGRVFKKVVGFSNAEFDHFSTASLITRSTNDIQQIQMLVVMLLRMVMFQLKFIKDRRLRLLVLPEPERRQ